MSKKKSQLDRAIEQIEAEILDLQRRYEGERAGLITASKKLREQKASAPVRKRRAQVAAAEAQS